MGAEREHGKALDTATASPAKPPAAAHPMGMLNPAWMSSPTGGASPQPMLSPPWMSAPAQSPSLQPAPASGQAQALLSLPWMSAPAQDPSKQPAGGGSQAQALLSPSWMSPGCLGQPQAGAAGSAPQAIAAGGAPELQYQPIDPSIATRFQQCTGENVSNVLIAENPDLLNQGKRGVAIQGCCVQVIPGSLFDLGLCAHELTHIVQQRGPAKGSSFESTDPESEAIAGSLAVTSNEKFIISKYCTKDKLFEEIGRNSVNNTEFQDFLDYPNYSKTVDGENYTDKTIRELKHTSPRADVYFEWMNKTHTLDRYYPSSGRGCFSISYCPKSKKTQVGISVFYEFISNRSCAETKNENKYGLKVNCGEEFPEQKMWINNESKDKWILTFEESIKDSWSNQYKISGEYVDELIKEDDFFFDFVDPHYDRISIENVDVEIVRTDNENAMYLVLIEKTEKHETSSVFTATKKERDNEEKSKKFKKIEDFLYESSQGAMLMDSLDHVFRANSDQMQRGTIHEIGHALGLDDEYPDEKYPDREVGDDPSSVMHSGEKFSLVITNISLKQYQRQPNKIFLLIQNIKFIN